MKDKKGGAITEQEKLTRATGVVGFFTLLSRMLGLVRDMVIAYFFGTGMVADAFLVAFRIPNLLRRLFAEGSLTIAFIPVFTELLKQKGKEEAFLMARAVLTLVSLILVLITLLGIILAPGIVRILAFGWHGFADKLELTVLLTRIMFPYILIVGLLAVFMGILNSLRHFAAPAAAPIFLNLGIIAATLWLAPHFSQPIIGTAIGVLIGGILQSVLQIPWLLREGLTLWPRWRPLDPALKKTGLLLLPAIFGSAIYQINQMINTLLATRLPEGSVAWLYYADRVVEFPLGLFAIAISTAALPSLARQAADQDMVRLRETFGHSLRMTFFIILPTMVGLMVLREPVFQILFQRGAFSVQSVKMAGQAFFCYCLGLWAFAGIKVMANGFYALQDTRTPVHIATLTLIANILFALVLIGPLKHVGLALALSCSSALQFILLAFYLRKKTSILVLKPILISISKSFCAALVMGGCVYWLYVRFWLTRPFLVFSNQILTLIGLIFSGLIIYLIMTKMMGCPELSFLGDLFPINRSKYNHSK
ncbi:MAG: murein biosynthesis integral membrane protein MurJ [Desulfobacteraceae bacterium]|nr:MAG: murein biosynthesis integral membrane protein MurJ [Desulfobacteraceae bacterium]